MTELFKPAIAFSMNRGTGKKGSRHICGVVHLHLRRSPSDSHTSITQLLPFVRSTSAIRKLTPHIHNLGVLAKIPSPVCAGEVKKVFLLFHLRIYPLISLPLGGPFSSAKEKCIFQKEE